MRDVHLIIFLLNAVLELHIYRRDQLIRDLDRTREGREPLLDYVERHTVRMELKQALSKLGMKCSRQLSKTQY